MTKNMAYHVTNVTKISRDAIVVVNSLMGVLANIRAANPVAITAACDYIDGIIEDADHIEIEHRRCLADMSNALRENFSGGE